VTEREREQLSAYLDAELPTESRQALAGSMTLEQQGYVAALKRLSLQLHLDADDLSVTAPVKQAVRREKSKVKRWYWGYGLLPVLLSLVLAAVFLYQRPLDVNITAEDLYPHYQDAFIVSDQP
jgi:anti-sigma factor RsiW